MCVAHSHSDADSYPGAYPNADRHPDAIPHTDSHPTGPAPALSLPADESPHTYLVEWWYFNAHLTTEEQDRYALHDVVFRVREPSSGIAGHVRHIGLSGGTAGYAHAELFEVAAPVESEPGDFELGVQGSLMGGSAGEDLHPAG